jgi:hypothetical protein
MKTNIYIDGFNFYYGCYKGAHGAAYAHLKWVDFALLATALVPDGEINQIRYFTARVKGTASDPAKSLRQETYFRALRTTPHLSIHLGNFTEPTKTGMLLRKDGKPDRLVTVRVREEKGSDVNLATYLLLDAFENDFHQAIVISNDVDLIEPICVVRERFCLRVGVVCPHDFVARELKGAADFARVFDKALLAQAQFPDTVIDQRGRRITRPRAWSLPSPAP